MLVYNDHQKQPSSSHLPRDDIEQRIVALDLEGRTIRNNTVGPNQWLGENARDLASYVADLRPVDHAFLDVLPNLHVITDDYVHESVEKAFNWNQVAAKLKDWEGDWFIVAFRSVRKSTANDSLLYDADARAQEEAIHSGGLLKYWFGDLNQHRECLAMCIWINRDYALKATHKPLHLEAAKLAGQMYDTYTLERYRLIKKAGESVFEITALPFSTPHPSFS
ncbi:hypothetical protein [Absidia glauca]|uniref:Uncharacterized protein n=1 Tax=Absidia glauca TaxID=4829 RepID=A0A163KGI0_ABSGL|nr:hypothetical protein [Absidia glauca]